MDYMMILRYTVLDINGAITTSGDMLSFLVHVKICFLFASPSPYATLTKGEVGVLHGAMSYLIQDDDGKIIEPHLISAGLDYYGVGLEHNFRKDLERAEYYSITDESALEVRGF